MTLTFTSGGFDGEVSDDDLTYAHAVTHVPTWELLSLTTGLHYWPLSIKSLDRSKQERVRDRGGRREEKRDV